MLYFFEYLPDKRNLSRQCGIRITQRDYLRGEWNLSEDSESNALSNDNLEGKVIDDHTFVGMLKLNLPDYKSENGELSLITSSYSSRVTSRLTEGTST